MEGGELGSRKGAVRSLMRGSSGLRARVGRRHRGRCAAVRVFSDLGFLEGGWVEAVR